MIPYNIPKWLYGKSFKDPETNEDKFRHQLICGRSYEPLVGAYLVNCGIDVQMAAATDAEKQTARKQIPDILANGYRIECKSTKFKKLPTNVEVDSIKSWLRKKEKPDFYVIVSKHSWRMVWIAGDDASRWIKGRAHGKPYFLCPKQHFQEIKYLVPILNAPKH